MIRHMGPNALHLERVTGMSKYVERYDIGYQQNKQCIVYYKNCFRYEYLKCGNSNTFEQLWRAYSF